MADFPDLKVAANLQSQLYALAAGAASQGLYATATALRGAGDTVVAETQSKLTVALAGSAPVAASVKPAQPKLAPATHLALIRTNSTLDGEDSEG